MAWCMGTIPDRATSTARRSTIRSLKFEVVFPPAGSTNNGFSAVTGLAERQDGLLQLELGSAEPIATQLQTFMAQDGVTLGP